MGKDLQGTIDDHAGLTEVVSTQVRVEYFAWIKKHWYTSAKFYRQVEQVIPEELLTKEAGKITVALGQLPIKDIYLRLKRKIRVKLFVTRSFGNRSAEQKLEMDYTIK